MRLVVQITMNKNRNRNQKQTTKTVETQTECETESESGNDVNIEFIRNIPLHPRERLKGKGKVAKFKYLGFKNDGKTSIF